MICCSNCGTENPPYLKICARCGSILIDPNEVDYEQADMGRYHSEDEYSSQRSDFSIGTGTFVISLSGD